MTIRYISSLAGGSGDGSTTASSGSTGAWTLAQMLAATPAAGDELRILADGTYSRSATGTLAYANGTAAANVAVTGANASGTVDGTRPTIQASAGSITLLNVTGSHVRLDLLILDGNSQTSVTGLTLGASYTRARRCKAMNCTSKGINVADSNNSTFLSRCEATGCSGTCGISVGSSSNVRYCDSHGNSCHGFQASLNAFLLGCISSGNTGSSADGFNGSSVGYHAAECTAHGNGRYGFDLTGNAGYGTLLSNCLSSGHTAGSGAGYGTDGVKAGAILLNCGGYNNTSHYNSTNLPVVEGFVTCSADPYTDAATRDFSLNNAAGGGALLRGAGYQLT